MTPRQVFSQFQELARAFDIRALDLFARDGVLVMPFAPSGMAKRVEGRDAIRALLEPKYAAAHEAGHKLGPYRNVRIHDTEHPEVIVIEFDVLVAVEDGGTEVRTSIHVMQVRDDEILEQRDYFDSMVMSSKLGLT